MNILQQFKELEKLKYRTIVENCFAKNQALIELCSVNYKYYSQILFGATVTKAGTIYTGIFTEIFEQILSRRIRLVKIANFTAPLEGKYYYVRTWRNFNSHLVRANNKEEAIQKAIEDYAVLPNKKYIVSLYKPRKKYGKHL